MSYRGYMKSLGFQIEKFLKIPPWSSGFKIRVVYQCPTVNGFKFALACVTVWAQHIYYFTFPLNSVPLL